ncbi:MAG TPA: peptidoglycan DD-metalloendopeptidase family protein [Solirubrobacteraceae bacterium]|nr:peptidoglycan DD-metalloendopeptidase family protein [Solirubrobacteraceae bacterium]
MPHRLRLFIGVALLPLALFALLPLVSSGQSKNLGSKIDRKKDQIAWRKGRERVLSTDVSGFTRKINALQSDITVLQTKQVRLQASLDRKRAELARIQEDLRRERLRLARLRARLAEARAALSKRLVELYKADQPDLVTVVLESNGFADLLERTEFMQRVSHQDARIINIVVKAKAEATATAKRLDKLEKRAQVVAAQIEDEVNQVSAVKGQLVDRRGRYQQARGEKSALLAKTRSDRHDLEGDLRALEAEQAKVLSALQASANSGSAPAGPVQQGSGGLIWPVNGPIVSGFGSRWGRLHAGVDIAVPAGTPIRAAQSGRVVLLGWTGGYGNYTCIQHTGGLSTCYAHQSRYGTSMGASVSQGDVIGYVGCTGHCFGDHLHFETRINGSPVNPAGYL